MPRTWTAKQGGGGERNSAIWWRGSGDSPKDRFNAWAAIDWQDQRSLRASDRDISKTAFLPRPRGQPHVGQHDSGKYYDSGRCRHEEPWIPAVPAAVLVPDARLQPQPVPLRLRGHHRYDPADRQEQRDGTATWQIDPNHQALLRGRVFPRRVHAARFRPRRCPARLHSKPVRPAAGHRFLSDAVHSSGLGGDPTQPVRRQLSVARVRTAQRQGQGGTVARSRGGYRQHRRRGTTRSTLSYTRTSRSTRYVGGYLSESRIRADAQQGTINPFGLNTPRRSPQAAARDPPGTRPNNKATNYGATAKISGEI